MLARWIAEMSEHIQSIDDNHLVGLGDEGFFNRTFTLKWYLDGTHGYDFDEFLQIDSIDFAGFHLYPDALETKPSYGNRWIEDHAESAAKANKPVILEEYGLKDAAAREDVYAEWLDTARRHGVASDLFWMLAASTGEGALYPDYDGYTLYPGTIPDCLRIDAR
jgi:mannan endo-1,4-beta-mannosidase